MADLKEICTVLAGKGHAALSQATVLDLVRQGMPEVSPGVYDPVACAGWMISRLRTEGFLHELQKRMHDVVDEVAESAVGKSAAEIESLWREQVEQVFSGFDTAEG